MTLVRTIGFTILLAFATAVPTFAISAFGAPVVVVYPLTLSGAVNNSEVGSDVAIVLGTKVGEGGNVIVRPYTPGTTRPGYLQAAITEKADYYVTGYLQQIGSDVSMILQVVSTHSGTLVYSSTTTIKTYGDAAAEGDALRAAILRHAGRGLAALDAPPPAPAPSTQPTANQGVNLTRALRRKAKATPAPSASPSSDAGLVPVSEIQASVASPSAKPSSLVASVTTSPLTSPATASVAPTAAPVTPAPAMPAAATTPIPRSIGARAALAKLGAAAVSDTLVVDAGGSADEAERARASESLVSALRRAGVAAARLPIASAQLDSGNAAAICRANRGAERFYEPVLAFAKNGDGRATATVSVTAIDCAGTTAGTREAAGASIDRATAALAASLASARL